jgi:hypothetical protein
MYTSAPGIKRLAGPGGGNTGLMFPTLHGILGSSDIVPAPTAPVTQSVVIRSTRATRNFCHVQSNNANTNYGRFNQYYSGQGGSSERFRTLMRFDLDEIPSTATIVKAEVRLYMDSAGGTAARTLGFHRSLVEFFGGNMNAGTPNVNVPASTWNNRIHDTTAWSTPGGQAGTEWAATATDSISVPVIVDRWYEWDLTADVQDFVDGTATNYGWWIINEDEDVANSFRRFLVDLTFQSTTPTLYVTYQIGGSGTWYNPQWDHRKKIEIESSFVGGNLTNFPLLVDLDADANISGKAYGNYEDLVFTASDGVTKLEHELAGFPGRATNNGAWTFFGGPRAIRHVGTHDRTYTGWVDYQGNVYVGAYDHTTNAWLTPVLLHAALIIDDHVAPTFMIRNDGHIMAFYARSHNHIHMRISSNPEDISAWGSVVTVGSGDSLSLVNYPNAIQLSGESNKIYLFCTTGSSTRTLRYMESTDGGATWGTPTSLYARATPIYYHACVNGTGRIDFVVSGNHPNHGSSGLYHFYYTGGSFYKTDGTEIAATLPFDIGDLTEVHPNDGTRPWNWGISVGNDGVPAIVYVHYPQSGLIIGDHNYRYARWNGSSWATSAVASGGRDISISNREYSGGLCLDVHDTSVIYASVPVNGVLNIARFTRSGSAWSRDKVITHDSTYDNIRPVPVVGAHSSMPIIWVFGPYSSYQSGTGGYRTSIRSSATTRSAKAWVKVPEISSTANTSIYCYYNNTNADPQDTPEMVWRGIYELVWHGELDYLNGAPAVYPPLWVVQNNVNVNAAGAVYKALEFKPVTASHQLPIGGINMRAWSAITSEIIIRRDGALGGATQSPISNWSSTGAGILQRITRSTGAFNGFLRTAAGQIGGAFTGTVAADSVKRLAMRYDTTNGFELFIDKSLDATVYGAGSGTLANVDSLNATLYLGDENTGNRFSGWMEVFRLSKDRKSTAWLDFVYDNIISNGDTITIGTEETP